MAYKYESILKTFSYSKESCKIISDFLLSGDITNPNILLNVTKVSKEFGKRAVNWFPNPSVVAFTKALIRIKIQDNDKKLKKAFKKFIKLNISEVRISDLTQNSGFITILENLDHKQLLKLMKEIGLVSVKKGNLKGSQNGKSVQGTWIHKDLAIRYAEWLDDEFSIWVSQKINLISMTLKL